MDISNLIGPLPPKDDAVLAKNLKPLKPPASPSWLVAIWMNFREEEQYGFIMGFVNIPLFSVLGAIYVSPYFLIVLALWVYLEVSARIYWHQWIGEWVRGLFAEAALTIPPFAEALKMLQESPNEMERRSVLLGTVYGTNMPVLLPDELLWHNLHITGSAGTWKSATMLALALQKIARGTEVMVFIDLGGDTAAMHQIREAAKKAGQPCYLFTIDPEKKSHVMNLLTQSHHRPGEPLGAGIAQALGIVKPQMRAEEAYFAGQSQRLGIRELETFKKPTIKEVMDEVGKLPLGELAKKINRPVRDIEHGESIHLAFRELAEIPGLNGTDSEESIDFMRIIGSGRPAVIYFFLPVSENLSGSLSVAKLATHSLMGAVQRLPRDHTRVTVVIDEAQSLISSAMQPFYQQMRKFGISIWTIHQNFEDLVGERNLLPMVVNNAGIGIHLGVRDPIGRKHIQTIGGDIQVMRETVSERGISITPIYEPRIKTEDFDLVNGSRGLAFCTINGRAGFASFNHTFICKLIGFSCSWDEFQRYLSMSWPELTNAVTMSSFYSPLIEGKPPVTTPESRSAAAALALAALAAHHPKQ